MRVLSSITGALCSVLLILGVWFALAIIAHAEPTNCGRACFDAGVTENPAITLIGGEQ